MRRFLVIASAILFPTLAAVIAPAAAQPVKVGDLGIVADAPVYVAIEKGYFAAERVQVELQPFGSAADTTVQLSTNAVQVVGGGLSAGLFNALGRDWPIRVAMARTRDMPGYSSDTLVLRQDLVGEVRTLADLKGRKVAVNSNFGALHYMVGRMLDSVGLSIKDVDLVIMSWPDMGVASVNKAIAAGAVVEPFAAQYSERNIAQPFKRAADVLRNPPLEVSVMLFSKDWTDKSPEQARAFTLAYLKGVRVYYDAMTGGAARPEVIDILTRHTRLTDKAMYDRIQWSYMDPNAEISRDGLRDQQAWYARAGAVARPVDIDKVIDTTFLDAAIAKLGRVAAK
jgi:NitT/TauT family transport system substrate-binding protein